MQAGQPLIIRPLQLHHGEVLRKAGVHRNDTIFQKSVQLLAYADDTDIIGRTKRDITAALSAIEREFTKMGLAINEGKIKYMLSTRRDVRRIDSQITGGNNTFETVKEFDFLVTTKNYVKTGDKT